MVVAAVLAALPPLPIGDRIRAGEDTATDEALLIRPFWPRTPPPLIPLAVKITVPLLIFPIGGRKRFSLTLLVTLLLLLLLGIKLMVLLLLMLVVCTLLLLLAEPFCCRCRMLLLVVGMIETSLLNLWGTGLT